MAAAGFVLHRDRVSRNCAAVSTAIRAPGARVFQAEVAGIAKIYTNAFRLKDA
jgi:hypothetical protein